MRAMFLCALQAFALFILPYFFLIQQVNDKTVACTDGRDKQYG